MIDALKQVLQGIGEMIEEYFTQTIVFGGILCFALFMGGMVAILDASLQQELTYSSTIEPAFIDICDVQDGNRLVYHADTYYIYVIDKDGLISPLNVKWESTE